MHIAEKAVLVTGANRGVGEALVKEALNTGAKRVFAGTRVALTNTDLHVTALTLDVTNASQIQRVMTRTANHYESIFVFASAIASPESH